MRKKMKVFEVQQKLSHVRASWCLYAKAIRTYVRSSAHALRSNLGTS
jgi:hypothetical protein